MRNNIGCKPVLARVQASSDASTATHAAGGAAASTASSTHQAKAAAGKKGNNVSKDEKAGIADAQGTPQPPVATAVQQPPANTGKSDKQPKSKAAPAAEAPRAVDVSRLDLRVGLITKAAKHPDADSLYVESIDCGEAEPRTVVSGLVKHIPEPEMQNRRVVVVANLKPTNLKSVKSYAMVLAATGTDGKVRRQAVNLLCLLSLMKLRCCCSMLSCTTTCRVTGTPERHVTNLLKTLPCTVSLAF